LKALLFGIVVVVISQITMLSLAPRMAFDVDRWSAIHNSLVALFNGEYPYNAVTHLGGEIGGFPGLFILALPFTLLGEEGLLQVFAGLLFF